MMKRVVATLLWFYSGWFAGAMVAGVIGLSPALAPILATAAAAIVGVDPRHLFWAATPRTDSTAASARRSVSNLA